MNVLLNWLSAFFRRNVDNGRRARRRSLAFEPLNRRLLLASDVVPLYRAEIAQFDDAMIGGAEIDSNPTAEETVDVSVAVDDGVEVRPIHVSGKSSGLDTIESAAASYGGYGGASPEFTELNVTYGDGKYSVSGTVSDDDLTGATIEIDNVSVPVNAAANGEFAVEITGNFYELVDVTVTDNAGNTDTMADVDVD